MSKLETLFENRLIQGTLFVILLLLPVCVTSFFAKDLYNSYWVPKSLVFLIVFVVISAFCGLGLLVATRRVRQLFNTSILGIFLFQLCLVLSAYFSKNASVSFYGSYWRQFGLIVILPLSFLPVAVLTALVRRRAVHYFVTTLVSFGCLYALLGVFQKFGIKVFNIDILYGRAAGFQGNPDFYAPTLLLLTLPCLSLFAKFIGERRYLLSMLFGGSFFIYLTAIICTMTRGTWIGLFGGCALWFVILCIAIWKTRIKYIVAGGVGCLIVVLLLAWGVSTLDKRLPQHREDTMDKVKSIFLMKNKVGLTNQRLYLWRDTLELIKDDLTHGHLFGSGWECFVRPFLPYKSLELAQVSKSIVYDNPHNQFLGMLAKTGLTGFAAFLFLFIWMSIISLRFIRRSKRFGDKIMVLGLFSAIVGYGLNLLVIFPTISSFLVFFMVYGLITAICYPYKPDFKKGHFSLILRSVACLWLVAMIVMAVIGIKNYNTLWKADVLFENGRKQIIRPNPGLDKIDASITSLKAAIALYPRESFYINELIRAIGLKATYYTKRKEYEKAEQLFNESVAIAEKSEPDNWGPDILYLTLGVNAFGLGYLDHAIIYFKKALSFDPWCYPAHTSLGAIYFFRYKITGEQENFYDAFKHSFITYAMILKYSPQWDRLAMHNTFKYGMELYKQTKDPDLLARIMEAFNIYARSGTNPKLVSDVEQFFWGTKFDGAARAARVYFVYQGVKRNSKMALAEKKERVKGVLKEMEAFKLENDPCYEVYLREMRSFISD